MFIAALKVVKKIIVFAYLVGTLCLGCKPPFICPQQHNKTVTFTSYKKYLKALNHPCFSMSLRLGDTIKIKDCKSIVFSIE